MNIYWISSPSDNEFDASLAISKNPDITCTFYIMKDGHDSHHEYHMSQMTKADNIIINEIPISIEHINAVLEHIKNSDKDLIILRHPMWIGGEQYAEEIAFALRNQPYVVSTWEWLPNMIMKQFPPIAHWKRIAVSNLQDRKLAKSTYPDKKILYLPFGTVYRDGDELASDPRYISDLVCDGQPHYDCFHCNGTKKISVDLLIKPAIETGFSLNLWGSRYGDTTICDWGHTPDFKLYHRGHFPTMEYPHVYSSSKLYLGVSWNYGTGGFSVRLARAFSCGIPVIWHKTAGGELEMPEGLLEWTDHPQVTKELIEHYITYPDEAIKMGQRAREWSLEYWEWGKQLKRIAEEVKSNG